MMARRPGAEEERPWKLAEHARLGKGKVVGVVVLDGWGEGPPDPFNCIHVADTPTLDALKKVPTRLCVSLLSRCLIGWVPTCHADGDRCSYLCLCGCMAGCSGEVEADQSSRDGGGAANG